MHDDVGEWLSLVGFGASVGVWVMAVWSAGRATAAAIAVAPSSWQRRFEGDFEAALTLRLRDFLLTPATLWALAFWTAAFLMLDIFDVILVVQLGAIAAYAVWETGTERQRRRQEVASSVRDGLEPVPANRRLSWWFAGSFLAAWVGFLSATCFLSFLIVGLAGV